MLHPRNRRYLKQILPFPIMWLVFGLVFAFIEYGILGPNADMYPATGNAYNFADGLLVIIISSLVIGSLQGWVEVIWLRRRFDRRALWVKIVLKTIFYMGFSIFFLSLVALINGLINQQGAGWEAVLTDFKRFADSFAFWSVMLYVAMALNFALFFSEINQYVGDGVLYNFLFGKYHRPRTEIRIFMFLDMKASTTIAESLGHSKYFELLKDYYADMTNPILETAGEIYQYVGDEIVVSWPSEAGVKDNNCIRCFEKISRRISKKADKYIAAYGLVPEFKAGYHIGEVTTGEIGIIKKDIIYTGDVLNTTARIQHECNTYNASALISGALLEELQKEDPISITEIGRLTLRGRKEPIRLHSVVF